MGEDESDSRSVPQRRNRAASDGRTTDGSTTDGRTGGMRFWERGVDGSL